MPAGGAPMANEALYGMSVDPTSVPAPEAVDLESFPGELSIAVDSDMSDDAAGSNSVWDDSYEADGTSRRLNSQDIELLQEHINGAYAEITIAGELPALLESYMPQAFGPWFEWDIVFEIPSTEIPALLDELGDREEFEITRNDQNADSPYVMVFFSYEE
jgi:hypothetical protein